MVMAPMAEDAEEATMCTPMIDAKGADYVARWPHAIADRYRCSVSYVARAVEAITGHAMPIMLSEATPSDAIGALTPDQATAVIAEVDRAIRDVRIRQRTCCYSCGLPLPCDCGCNRSWHDGP